MTEVTHEEQKLGIYAYDESWTTRVMMVDVVLCSRRPYIDIRRNKEMIPLSDLGLFIHVPGYVAPIAIALQ